MKIRGLHSGIGGILCASAAWTVAANADVRPKTAPVVITHTENGSVTFSGARGQAETVVPISKGSKCTGRAQDKTTYTQSSCSFEPASATINGNPVTVYWTSPSGTGTRQGNTVSFSQLLILRVVKKGPDGFDCRSAPFQAQPPTVSGPLDTTKESVAFRLADGLDRLGVGFGTGPQCSVAQKQALDDALAKIRDISQHLHVACW